MDVDPNDTKFGSTTDDPHIYQTTEIVQCTELSSNEIFETILLDSRKSYTYIRNRFTGLGFSLFLTCLI